MGGCGQIGGFLAPVLNGEEGMSLRVQIGQLEETNAPIELKVACRKISYRGSPHAPHIGSSNYFERRLSVRILSYIRMLA